MFYVNLMFFDQSFWVGVKSSLEFAPFFNVKVSEILYEIQLTRY